MCVRVCSRRESIQQQYICTCVFSPAELEFTCQRDLVPTSSSARGSPAPRRFKRSCPARHRRRRPPLSASESMSMTVPATSHVGSSRSAMAQTAIRISQTLGACTRQESRFKDVGLPGRGGCLSMQDAAGFVRAARPGAGKAHRQEDHKVRSVGLGKLHVDVLCHEWYHTGSCSE